MIEETSLLNHPDFEKLPSLIPFWESLAKTLQDVTKNPYAFLKALDKLQEEMWGLLKNSPLQKNLSQLK